MLCDNIELDKKNRLVCLTFDSFTLNESGYTNITFDEWLAVAAEIQQAMRK